MCGETNSEDGVNYDDFLGLLPPDFSRFDNRGFDKRGKHGNRDYSTMGSSTSGPVSVPGHEGNHTQGNSTFTDMNATLVPGSMPRSPHKISFMGTKGAAVEPERDPLLGDERRNVEFRPYDMRKPLPMPLM